MMMRKTVRLAVAQLSAQYRLAQSPLPIQGKGVAVPVNSLSTITRVAPKAIDNGHVTVHSHAILWLALGLGICLSLTIAIMSAVSRGHQVVPETQAPAWVNVQATEQINDLKDEVAKLKETIEAQQVEIQKLWREVQTAQFQVLEIKNPTPVGHAGLVLSIQGASEK